MGGTDDREDVVDYGSNCPSAEPNERDDRGPEAQLALTQKWTCGGWENEGRSGAQINLPGAAGERKNVGFMSPNPANRRSFP